MTDGNLVDLKALFQSGAQAVQQGRFGEAMAIADRILASKPADYDALQLKIMAAVHGGRGATALPVAEALARDYPDDMYAQNTLGAVLQVCGRLADAAAAYRHAVKRWPRYPDAWLNLALACAAQGEHREAIEAFRTVLTLGQRNIHILANLGASLLQAGDAAGAVEAFREAVALDPANAALRGDYGRVREHLSAAMLAQGRLDDAERVTVETQKLGVATDRTFVHQTVARMHRGDFAAAIAPAREAMRIAPGSAEAPGLAGTAMLEAGEDFDEALGLFQAAARLDPGAARWRFLEALAWPPVLDSLEQAARRAREVDNALERLEANPGTLADPFREVGKTPFYMAYAGLDDTQWQGKIARAYLRACPALGWSAPHVGRRPGAAKKRIRLGILSANLTNHTIGKLNIGFVQEIDRSRFEVIVLRPRGASDTLSSLVAQAADAVVELPLDLQAARASVAQAELDALFYPDVGMDPFTYYLAFARLAPVQFTTWGHPVTTGIPNMDYFVSTRHAEPAGAQRFYHERLVQFESLPSFYHPPRDASKIDVRARLGPPKDARLYACPQTLFKFHPSQDRAICEVLRRDRNAVVLLIKSRHAGWNRKLQFRLEREGPDVAQRIRFVDPMPLPDFFALVADADALLDTFWFGGGNSSYEAFSLGRPVVTLPAATMRGRVTAAWYDVMGERSWVAESPEDYVERAVLLANDESRRREARATIAERARRLLGNKDVVRELEAFVADALSPQGF